MPDIPCTLSIYLSIYLSILFYTEANIWQLRTRELVVSDVHLMDGGYIYTLATLWIDFHIKMHCELWFVGGDALKKIKMAKKKQTWREPLSYNSDSDEEHATVKREDERKDAQLTKSVERPQQSFDHPVFKQISKANSFIHSMTTHEIVDKLKELGLSEKYVSNYFALC